MLEVSSPNINAGAFTDVTAAAVGGSFVSGGYNATISTAFMSPIAGRMAWSGISAGGYITTVANLGPNVVGQTIKLRFRMASDNSVTAAGWRIDTVSVVVGVCPSPTPSPSATPSPGACIWIAGPVVPSPILDEPVVTVGNNLYSFAGVQNGAIVATSYKFDGATWTTIAPLPTAVEFAAAVTDGTNIFVLGGALTGTGTPQTTLYRYNVAANTYTTLAPFTTGTWNHAAVYLNGKIYKFAGTGPATASTNVLEIYDIASNTWTVGAPYPLAISFVSAFAQGNFIYAAGGIDSVTSTGSVKTFRYDPATNSWNDAAIADLPQTRWGAASSFYNNGGVLAGGYVNGSVTANISTSAISWDLASNTWSSLPNMLQERSRTNGAVLGGSFYVVGGRSIASPAFVGTNDNQKLTCGASASPTPSPSGTPSATPTATATGTPTATATATVASSATPSCPPVLTQSSSQAVTAANSASCNNGVGHADNSYWRAFNMGTLVGGAQYNVASVSFGVESANVTQSVTVRLYTTANFPAGFPGSLTQIGTTTVSVTSAQTGTVVTTPLVAVVPAGTSQLVMELFTPNGQVAGNLFFVGSNAAAQSGPSYLSAADCGVTVPTDTSAIGFPNMHIVFNVNGSCGGPPPTPTPTPPTPTPTPTPSPSPTPTPTHLRPRAQHRIRQHRRSTCRRACSCRRATE